MSIRANVDPRGLDQRAQFERLAITNSGGDKVPVWNPIGRSCWVRVDGAKASSPEPLLQDALRSVRDYTFWIRADVYKRKALTVKDRIRWDGKLFNIADIPDQQLRGRWIAVIARTGQNEG